MREEDGERTSACVYLDCCFKDSKWIGFILHSGLPHIIQSQEEAMCKIWSELRLKHTQKKHQEEETTLVILKTSLSIVHSLVSTETTQFIRYTLKMSRREIFLHLFFLLNKYNHTPSDLKTSLAALLMHQKTLQTKKLNKKLLICHNNLWFWSK